MANGNVTSPPAATHFAIYKHPPWLCGYASVIHFCAGKSCFYTFPSDDLKITCIYITLPITGRWEYVIGRKLSSVIISALLFIRDHFRNFVVIVHFLSVFAASFAQPNEIPIENWAGTDVTYFPLLFLALSAVIIVSLLLGETMPMEEEIPPFSINISQRIKFLARNVVHKPMEFISAKSVLLCSLSISVLYIVHTQMETKMMRSGCIVLVLLLIA